MKTTILGFFTLLFPPCELKNYFLKFFGWKIKSNVSIGFSYISSTSVILDYNVKIGHFNFITAPYLKMGTKAYIQNLNRINGPIYLLLGNSSAIGNLNTIKRAKQPISWGKAMLKIGEGSKITSKHTLDCTRSIHIGKHSIIAGQSSQLWTHGYIHNSIGKDRFRIDGSIKIGDNVYIGSATIINPGICIANAITIGSHATVAKPLSKPGLYVTQPLRYIPFNYEESFTKYPSVKTPNLVEKVVHKKC